MKEKYRILTNGNTFKIQNRLFLIWFDVSGHFKTLQEAKTLVSALEYKQNKIVWKPL